MMALEHNDKLEKTASVLIQRAFCESMWSMSKERIIQKMRGFGDREHETSFCEEVFSLALEQGILIPDKDDPRYFSVNPQR
jgi:hypothetical protein